MKLLNNLKLTDIRGKIINTKDVKIKIIQTILNKKSIPKCQDKWKHARYLFWFPPFVHIVKILSMLGLIFDRTRDTCLNKGIPDKFKKEIETLMWDFIWDGKVNQIKRDVCCLDIENGGISVLVSTFCTHCKNFVHAWIDF
jgi:hypothetical protein